MSSRQVDANGFQDSQSYKNNQNLQKYRPLAPKLPYTQMVDSSSRQFLNFQLTSKSGTQVLKPSTPMVAADINTRVIERSNIIVDTTIRERPNDYDSLHETNDFDQEYLMDLEKVKKLRQEKKKDIIKSKTAESIKRRLNRLLEKYGKVKQENYQSGSG
ncbi:13976_t:CDS:2 [Funneliformis geosporum]|uniref:7595_t:CDS:1 n=1 Tax=Funneliformis geosporum TaxID=1117311 RepID=A0A9W4T0Y1_9GLOM|nr:7595_t:CDS:2 [Funneliformis geosporum]CAI2189199.1 13976_t:CDS:2 [Funneliformis geosporum]